MPGRGGTELLRRLRERWAGLRVLLISGCSAAGTFHRDAAGPGVDPLRKPFTPRELLARVRECLDRPPRDEPDA